MTCSQAHRVDRNRPVGEWLDLKPRWARSIITCLARIGGRSVGIVANQPNHLGGILDVDSSDKAARFMPRSATPSLHPARPFLQDVPGFADLAPKVEHEGIIRHGAKMLHVMAAATVPKISRNGWSEKDLWQPAIM